MLASCLRMLKGEEAPLDVVRGGLLSNPFTWPSVNTSLTGLDEGIERHERLDINVISGWYYTGKQGPFFGFFVILLFYFLDI